MIFLLFGCNDLNNVVVDYDTLVKTYITFIKRLQKDYPNAKVIVQITFPISTKYYTNKSYKVYITNERVMEFGKRKKKELTNKTNRYIMVM